MKHAADVASFSLDNAPHGTAIAAGGMFGFAEPGAPVEIEEKDSLRDLLRRSTGVARSSAPQISLSAFGARKKPPAPRRPAPSASWWDNDLE